MIKRPFFTLFMAALLMPALIVAQSEASQPNLVPNPSFEEFQGFPIGWYYKGSDFNDVVRYWSSATKASPDAYGSRVRVPLSWAEKGFGKQTPHIGQAMAGITVYGCANGKPHCREYIQIQLKEPLVAGQNYTVDFWVAHLPLSLRINKLGAYFSNKKIDTPTENRLSFTPHVFADKIIHAENGGWAHFTGKFSANNEGEWLIIGNFFSDEETTTSTPSVSNTSGSLNFAYYYIDDVAVRKAEPILPVSIKEDDLTRVPLKVGKVITLKDIFFDSDRSELLPRSNVELDKLLQIMRDNPRLEIEIIGHTDNVGDVNYNLTLSRRRATQVMEYLSKNGIATRRMQVSGFGASQPIAPNESEETRHLNRRVAFRILKM